MKTIKVSLDLIYRVLNGCPVPKPRMTKESRDSALLLDIFPTSSLEGTCFSHDFDNFQVFQIPRTLLRTGVVIQCKMGGMVRMGKFLHSCGSMLSGPRQCSGRELDEQFTCRSVEHKRIPGRIIPTEHSRCKSILHWGNCTNSYTGLGIHSTESAFLESISKLVSRPTLVEKS